MSVLLNSMKNSPVVQAAAIKKPIIGMLLPFPAGALVLRLALRLGSAQRVVDAMVIVALISVLCVVAAVLVRFLPEKLEVTEDPMIVSDCFGFRSMPFKSLYRVRLGFWARGNCCVAITDTQMKVVRAGHFFSRRMIDELVQLVSAYARQLVW